MQIRAKDQPIDANPRYFRGAKGDGCIWLAVFVLAFAAPRLGMAQVAEDAPAELKGVEIVEHPEAQVPLDLEFTNADGRTIALKQFFDGKRPVLLTLNYSNCPMLCNLQLTGLFTGLSAMEWELGGKFRMVTVSIDPKEQPERAAQTKQHYLDAYGRPGVGQGWNVLVGREANIQKLAKTVGFGYVYLPDTNEYAHAAVTMVLTPDGRVSRYLYGVEYDPQTLKLSLLEAAEGKIGTAFDQVILYCFHYDPSTRRYGPAAMNLMRAGGLLTLVVLGGMVFFFWRRSPAETARS